MTSYNPADATRFKSFEGGNKKIISTDPSAPLNEKNNPNTNLPCQYPEPTATCPICREDRRIVTKKFESWELFEHLESKAHTKTNLASFFAYEAVFNQFWEPE